VSSLHVELFENCGADGILGKNDTSNVSLTIDFDAEESAFQAGIGVLVLFQEPGLNFDRSFGSVLWVQH